jgi:hypothetical protein
VRDVNLREPRHFAAAREAIAAAPASILPGMTPSRWISLVFLIGCAAAKPAPTTPSSTPPAVAVPAPTCDARQLGILHDADTRAAPYSSAEHVAKNFADGRVAWLMKDASYQSYVVKPGAKKWGRCDDTGCYVFVAPAPVIHAAIEKSMTEGHHDPAALGQALGLPAANFEGPLRMMTLDVRVAACARLPVDADPGVWKCQTPEDKDCFHFGGYTSGGIPELMVIDAPVDQTKIEEVQ